MKSIVSVHNTNFSLIQIVHNEIVNILLKISHSKHKHSVYEAMRRKGWGETDEESFDAVDNRAKLS